MCFFFLLCGLELSQGLFIMAAVATLHRCCLVYAEGLQVDAHTEVKERSERKSENLRCVQKGRGQEKAAHEN